MLSSLIIKQEAKRLGFFACGIAKALPVDEDMRKQYQKWLENGNEAEMHYMANNVEKRLDPRLLVPGVKTIVSVALNYAPKETLPTGEYQLAAYALGLDYHDLMKERLRLLAENISPTPLPSPSQIEGENLVRCFCDTAPVLERYWAMKAGLGWIGKNHQLIIPHAGAMFFLGEVFLPFEVDSYDTPLLNRCGSCHRCLDACPTKAISEKPTFKTEKCLSYQLIENRGELSSEAKAAMGNTIYGCDRCLTACPWNRFATPSTEPSLQVKPELLMMTKEDWHNLTVEEYRKLFKGSAVKRVKFEGLKRNIAAKEQ